MTNPTLSIVIPTRNRPDLAIAAVESVIRSGRSDVQVVVSDNSTVIEAVTLLRDYCSTVSGPSQIAYVRPQRPLPMSEHWDWAMHEALGRGAGTHVMFLTDRRRLLPAALNELLALARTYPDQIISFGEDWVNDLGEGASLNQVAWTGRVVDVSSGHLLHLASRGEFAGCTPRVPIALYPTWVLGSVDSRYGSIFASIAPDYCLAYRALNCVPAIKVLDKSLLVHSALGRSNGLSQRSGVPNADHADFLDQVGGAPRMNPSAPVPELHTIMNALFNEYCFVRSESNGAGMPPVHWPSYLATIGSELVNVENPALAASLAKTLGTLGWRRRPRWRRYLGRLVFLARTDPLGLAWRLGVLLFANAITQPVWMKLAAWGMRPPSSPHFVFSSAEAALRYAELHPRAPRRGLGHLRKEGIIVRGQTAHPSSLSASSSQFGT
jgi:hypothetical protein